jgi:hypothetical protein
LAQLEAELAGKTLSEAHDLVLAQNGLPVDAGRWSTPWTDLAGTDCIESLVSSSDIDRGAPISPLPGDLPYKRSLLSSQVTRGSTEQRAVNSLFGHIADYHNSLPATAT